MPNGKAFVISNILLNHNARELMTIDPKATRRNKPKDFHRLFADAVKMQRVMQVARDGINTVATVRGGTSVKNRPRNNSKISLRASWE